MWVVKQKPMIGGLCVHFVCLFVLLIGYIFSLKKNVMCLYVSLIPRFVFSCHKTSLLLYCNLTSTTQLHILPVADYYYYYSLFLFLPFPFFFLITFFFFCMCVCVYVFGFVLDVFRWSLEVRG
ncbi:hypothetical protein TCDM_07026 [Trypanosoma cruzi Dm28c]|uniref:Uncharacterized protein n=1 Tax=Trypanosoma cruzi Dm28c TaxID=1416333 RepID=V5DBD4_TRYCR|nr:hypothetical protein TCDM_07026 [Trypanosoma cruzi Dm28c]